MEIRFYRSVPEPAVCVQPPTSDEAGDALFALVCLERDADPDANNHTGYDYWGVYGDDGEAIGAWADPQAIEEIGYDELPNPVTFYPPPFSGTGTYYVRARNESGQFVADDPSTPDVNEAWTPVTL